MAEVDRICDLEVCDLDGPALIEKWTQRFRAPNGTWSLFEDQAKSLEQAAAFRGAFLPITTGGGKTLTAMLLPLAMGIAPEKTVVLCPPGLAEEAAKERDTYLEHFDIEPNGRSVTYVSQSALSRQDGVTLLDDLAPDLIVVDEGHALKNPNSARTNRFLKYLKANPHCLLAIMSGTFSTTGKLEEFSHLTTLALRENSPVPRHYPTMKGWSRVLDAIPDMPATSQDWWSMGRLIKEFADEGLEGREQARSAFKNRLKTCPGVVVSDGDSCDQPIYGYMLKDAPIPVQVKDAIRIARNDLLLPNGIDIDTPMHAAAKSKQLSLGYFYYPEWPEGVVDREWMYARREYSAAVWNYVKTGRKGLDTIGLVENALRAGTLGHTQLESLWARWETVSDRPEPPRAVEWVDESVMHWYLDRAKGLVEEHGPMLLWCFHEAEQEWFEAQGVARNPVGQRPIHEPDVGLATVSIASHGTGYNLQQWSNCMVLHPPSNAGMWQQMIARLHRAGQTKPVRVWIAQHTTPFRNAWRKARTQAQAIETNMDLRMKIEHMVWGGQEIDETVLDLTDVSSIFD